jgi:hypothetical protein
MMKPTIHINGTPRNDLFDNYVTAMLAVEAAIDALTQHTAPNGRDYYPQGDHALRQAQAEHQARLQALNAVSLELHALAEHAS